MAAVAAEKAKDRAAELEKEKVRIAAQAERERLDRIAARDLQMAMVREITKTSQEQQKEMRKVAKEERKEMMITLQSMIDQQKQQVPQAVQLGSLITSPLTSLTSGNNSSNKRI